MDDEGIALTGDDIIDSGIESNRAKRSAEIEVE